MVAKSYVRIDDGATMVEVAPHQYVNGRILEMQGRLVQAMPRPPIKKVAKEKAAATTKEEATATEPAAAT